METFAVITVTREDVCFALTDISLRLSDAMMETIADHMSEAYRVAGLYYWDVVTEAAEAVLEEQE